MFVARVPSEEFSEKNDLRIGLIYKVNMCEVIINLSPQVFSFSIQVDIKRLWKLELKLNCEAGLSWCKNIFEICALVF